MTVQQVRWTPVQSWAACMRWCRWCLGRTRSRGGRRAGQGVLSPWLLASQCGGRDGAPPPSPPPGAPAPAPRTRTTVGTPRSRRRCWTPRGRRRGGTPRRDTTLGWSCPRNTPGPSCPCTGPTSGPAQVRSDGYPMRALYDATTQWHHRRSPTSVSDLDICPLPQSWCHCWSGFPPVSSFRTWAVLCPSELVLLLVRPFLGFCLPYKDCTPWRSPFVPFLYCVPQS